MAGAFIYFNGVLGLPRLVYSTNLNSNEADLKILARMTNLAGNTAALGDFAAGNFSVVPEPATWGLLLLGFAAMGSAMRVSRRKQRLALSYS